MLDITTILLVIKYKSHTRFVAQVTTITCEYPIVIENRVLYNRLNCYDI